MPDIEHDPQAVYRFIRDELQLDGNPTLNMASFVTTVMDEEADQLIRDNLGKKLHRWGSVQPYSLEIEQRCVRMLQIFSTRRTIRKQHKNWLMTTTSPVVGEL